MNVDAREAPLEETRGEAIASVERALRIVEWLAASPGGLSFGDIVERLSVNKAIAFKLLNTLLGAGYVFHDEPSATYRLTFQVANLALRKLSGARLLEQSRALLLPLADETEELVRLAVVEDHGDTPRLTWVLTLLPPRQVLQIDPNYSLQIGLHTHAAGKAWLATLPFPQALALVKARGFRAMTAHSITTVDKLRKDLERTAARGYSLTVDEHALGVSAVGAPVFAEGLDGTRTCVGVVTVAAPSARRSPAQFEAWAPALIAVARRMGAVWPLEPPRVAPASG